jgi:hypothetical protein
VLTVIATIMTITLYAVLIVNVTITGRSKCSVSSYCDKMTITGRSVFSTNSDVTITGRSIYSANSYCDNKDNNGVLYM